MCRAHASQSIANGLPCKIAGSHDGRPRAEPFFQKDSMPIPFLYPGTAYAPWMAPTRDDSPSSDVGLEGKHPLIPNFTQAELRQMVLEVIG